MVEPEVAPPAPRPMPWLVWVGGGLALLVLAFVFLMPSHVHGPEPGRRSRCVSNLKQFGIAVQNYHDQHKSFPPAFIADEHGVPMHSWRVVLLPYFESEELLALHSQYRFDEPWNGPNNRKLLDKAPGLFRCPNDEDNNSETNYLAVVGPRTVWPGRSNTEYGDIKDGVSRTIAVVECSDSGINWLEPRDVTFDDASLGINNLQTRPAIRSRHSGGANILFADGAVHFLSDEIPAKTLHALLTSAGGEEVEIPQ